MIESTADVIVRPFNSPLEFGLRMLFLLEAARERGADLQRLVAYDYLLVHSADVSNGPPSVHPAVPYRGAEFLIKRDLVQSGLALMISRELIFKEFHVTGVRYRATMLTTPFLKLLRSSYSQTLRQRASWVVDRFGALHDDRLASFMDENIGRWGAEFDRISAIADLELS